MKQLTEHFTFEELTVTNNAELQERNRMEALEFVPALIEVAKLLEYLRAGISRPLSIHSGFRCPELNGATIGSSKTSQHMKGEAADFSGPGLDDEEANNWLFNSTLEVLHTKNLEFGQCIKEEALRPYGKVHWVHISLGKPWRSADRCGEIMTMKNGVYQLIEKVVLP